MKADVYHSFRAAYQCRLNLALAGCEILPSRILSASSADSLSSRIGSCMDIRGLSEVSLRGHAAMHAHCTHTSPKVLSMIIP